MFHSAALGEGYLCISKGKGLTFGYLFWGLEKRQEEHKWGWEAFSQTKWFD